MSACNTRNMYCRIIKIITFNDPSLSLWLKILIFNIQTLQKWQDYLGQVVLSLAITEQVDQHQNTVNCWNSGTLQSCKANDLHFISYEWCQRFSPHWPALWSECPVLPLDAQGRQGGRCTWPIENVLYQFVWRRSLIVLLPEGVGVHLARLSWLLHDAFVVIHHHLCCNIAFVGFSNIK